ncbi:MAG TPA: hypothetical protein VE526_17285 [Solirubrobacteraceae bacterium]|nr:hypothetical protein [Solirubrobacteraceae bacterium]
MAPFSRRGKTARNLALAEAALALARDRTQAKSSKRSRGKLLLAGGAVVAAGAAALLKRDKVAGLLPSRAGEPETAPPPPVPSQPSNYDAPGPVANTATPIPAPDPRPDPLAEQRPQIDEAAEEAAAAAEAANIGGPPAEYAGEALDAPAGEAFRPLAEAGEGESEGQEQAEADLAENASYRDAGMSGAQRQIEDAIEEADQPFAGETVAGVAPLGDQPAEDAAAAGPPATPVVEPEPAPPASEPPTWTPTPSTPEPAAPTSEPAASTPEPAMPTSEPEPAAPAPPEPERAPSPPESAQESFLPPTPATPEPQTPPDPATGTGKDDDEPDDWRTWSGRAVNP